MTPLETELAYFEANKAEYQKNYPGKFVLIKGTEFAGDFTSQAEAYEVGLKRFGNQPFLIKHVTDDHR